MLAPQPRSCPAVSDREAVRRSQREIVMQFAHSVLNLRSVTIQRQHMRDASTRRSALANIVRELSFRNGRPTAP